MTEALTKTGSLNFSRRSRRFRRCMLALLAFSISVIYFGVKLYNAVGLVNGYPMLVYPVSSIQYPV